MLKRTELFWQNTTSEFSGKSPPPPPPPPPLKKKKKEATKHLNGENRDVEYLSAFGWPIKRNFTGNDSVRYNFTGWS